MGAAVSSGAGGFRVYEVLQNSPAADAGIEPFFDFIVEVDGIPTSSDQQAFFSAIKDVRDVFIIPREWSGPGLLGATVKYGYVEDASDQGVHVLEIQENSPADLAGLVPFKDYIITCGNILIRNPDDLAEVLRSSRSEPASELHLTVYNASNQSIRNLALNLAENGSLGCSIGYGVLHRIPMSTRGAPSLVQRTPVTPLPTIASAENAVSEEPPTRVEPLPSTEVVAAAESPKKSTGPIESSSPRVHPEAETSAIPAVPESRPNDVSALFT